MMESPKNSRDFEKLVRKELSNIFTVENTPDTNVTFTATHKKTGQTLAIRCLFSDDGSTRVEAVEVIGHMQSSVEECVPCVVIYNSEDNVICVEGEL